MTLQMLGILHEREKAEARERVIARFENDGQLFEWGDFDEVSGEYGSPFPLFRTQDSRRIYKHMNPRGETPTAIVLEEHENGTKHIVRLSDADMNDLGRLKEKKRVNEARLEHVGKYRAKLAAKQRKTSRVIVTHLISPFTDTRGVSTLDELERLIEANPGIEMKVVRGSAVVVSAPDEAELHDYVDQMKLTRTDANGLHSTIRHDVGQARLIARHIHDLELLAIEYLVTGKRPKADDNPKALANRVGPGGIWIT